MLYNGRNNAYTLITETKKTTHIGHHLLSERDYVTFGSLLSQVCLSSVTFLRPTQGVETFGNISSPFCISLPSCDLRAKF